MEKRFVSTWVFAAILSMVSPGSADAPGAAFCAPLSIEPSHLRVAPGGATELRAKGGSGRATFTAVGDPAGSVVSPGGGLRAGPQASMFTVIARDAICEAETRLDVEVTGPFEVEPARASIGRRGQMRFHASGAAGDVHYELLERPAGAAAGAVDDTGAFTAGDQDGSYRVLASDLGSGREVRLEVVVGGVREPLHPRVPYLAIPVGGRVRLDWDGAMGALEPALVAQGRVTMSDGALFFDGAEAHPGIVEVKVTDAFSHQHASAHVILGETYGSPSVARGTQSLAGDLASGDLNGDGRADLVVGHAERSKVGLEAGGVLVYYGAANGFAGEPDLVLEGQNAGDRYGAVLRVEDVNGDGIDDVVVGSPDEALGESGRGAVALYLGSRRGLAPVPERVLAGEGAGNRFGTALFTEDLTGDGAPELIVTAPGAKSPFAKACEGGRAYVYRNRQGVRGVFEAVPWQVIDLREPLTDDGIAAVPCSSTPLGAGRSVAVLDMDGDRVLDLVVGAPLTSFPTPGHAEGAVLVYKGAPDGRFATSPAWAIHLDPSVRVDGAQFGAGLDVVRAAAASAPVLLVRAPSFAPRGVDGRPMPNAGALWLFAPGALGAAAPPVGESPRVRVVTTRLAKGYFAGEAPNRGVGRSASVADFDGDGKNELIVGASTPGSPSAVLVVSLADLSSGKSTWPTATLGSPPNQVQGFRVTALREAHATGVASWAAWRSTTFGPFVGAIDYVTPAAGPISSLWEKRRAIELPNFGASDRAGASVAFLDPAKGPVRLLVGSPGANSPPSVDPPRASGERLRTGVVDAFDVGGVRREPLFRAFVDRSEARIGDSVAVLDFDGDGEMEVAIGDPNESAGGLVPEGYADPDECVATGAGGKPVAVPGRGVVRIYSVVGGALVEKFRLTAPRESARMDPPLYLRNHFGSSLAVADVNGDKMDDLVVGRPGGRDASGAEVVLGRKADVTGRVLIACNAGQSGNHGAFLTEAARPGDPVVQGVAVAGIGDLDRDGCDEVALSITRASIPGNPPRAGVLVAFGYDGSGARCHGHRTPFLLRLVVDDHPLLDNIPGDAITRLDDLLDVRGAPTGMGSALARGHGDLTGDGVPDVVFRDADLATMDRQGPAVEILSGAYLAGLCPDHLCREGRKGALFADAEWHVVAVHAVPPAARRLVRSRELAPRFGTAIAVGDISGDGVADLVIGSPDDSEQAPFVGEVLVYRGGVTELGPRAPGEPSPWLIAAGDVQERSLFGSALAVSHEPARGAGVWLAVGAPASSRGHAGGGVGAAYTFHLEGAK